MSGSRRTLGDLMADEEREQQLLAELQQVKDRRAQDAPRLEWVSERVAPFFDLASRVNEMLAPLSATVERVNAFRALARAAGLLDLASHLPAAMRAALEQPVKKPGRPSKEAAILDCYADLLQAKPDLANRSDREAAEAILADFARRGEPLDRGQRTIMNILSRYHRQRLLAALGPGDALPPRRNTRAGGAQGVAGKRGGRPTEAGMILARYAWLIRRVPGLADKPYREIAEVIRGTTVRDGEPLKPLKSSQRTIENILSRHDQTQRPIPGEWERLVDDGVSIRMVPIGAKTPRRNGRD